MSGFKSILKKYSNWIINFLLAAILIYAVGRTYFQLTDGFKESNIIEDINEEPNHNLNISNIEKDQIKKILAQPFYYLGKGCQSYVFISNDKKYVIKFLKHQ